jgi:CHASE3 domain sensor protein
MTENQKDSVKKSFWQRNFFLLIVLLLMALGGGGYLYQQNILTFQTSQQLNNSEKIVSDLAKTQPILDNNQELQDKVDRLENLILQLAENVQNIPQSTIVQPAEPRQQVVLSNDEAYELILSINQIITNIDQQQTRNKHIQKLQNQYLFFQDQKFEELLTLPDYTYLIQQINQSEQKYIQEEFMKNDNFSWFKKIIENIFEINIAKNSTYPISGYLNALMNRQYDLALMEYEKLSPNQKIFFKSSFELAQAYDQQKVFLENMI